jgi:hypothetical protein
MIRLAYVDYDNITSALDVNAPHGGRPLMVAAASFLAGLWLDPR